MKHLLQGVAALAAASFLIGCTSNKPAQTVRPNNATVTSPGPQDGLKLDCDGDLDCYIQCRHQLIDDADCEGYGYKSWFKDAFDKCLAGPGNFDPDIGGDDFDCSNMDESKWTK